ncbi:MULTISPECIES: hypothetical protein [Bacteria]|uniref:Uncharacterized protein n=1 Tax=Sulfurihydrogenibium yellowstonense SS-5 TaxID=432331 RepID=C4FHL6_9AQUI|nr:MULTISPECIES: hypothetical protein [Bacteria]EEP61450.1 hypothetical protein SULYE_0044 [Sulfurihydrogenibium yellowstonense SS-5]HBW58898.1 hypothetical protein [Thermoanaerobacter sp.]
MERPECPDVYKNKFLSLLRDSLIFLKYGQICKLSNKEEKSVELEFIYLSPNTDNRYQKQIGSVGRIYARLDIRYVEHILLDKLYDINNTYPFSSLIDKSITYLAFYAKQEIEKEIINTLLQNSYPYPSQKQSNDLSTKKSLREEIISGIDELIKNKVPPFQDGYYACFIHPRKLEELISSQYSSLLPVEEGGKKFYVDCFGIKYIPTQTSLFIKHVGDEEVYQTIIVGADAYGIVDLDENNVNIICKNIDQKTIIGYEINFSVKIVNIQAIKKIESS